MFICPQIYQLTKPERTLLLTAFRHVFVQNATDGVNHLRRFSSTTHILMFGQERHVLSAHGQPSFKGLTFLERNSFAGRLRQSSQSLFSQIIQQRHAIANRFRESCAQNINGTMISHISLTCSHATDFMLAFSIQAQRPKTARTHGSPIRWCLRQTTRHRRTHGPVHTSYTGGARGNHADAA